MKWIILIAGLLVYIDTAMESGNNRLASAIVFGVTVLAVVILSVCGM